MGTANKTATQSYEQLYFSALETAWQDFIEEEQQGNIFTELRLMKKVEAARTLYKSKMLDQKKGRR